MIPKLSVWHSRQPRNRIMDASTSWQVVGAVAFESGIVAPDVKMDAIDESTIEAVRWELFRLGAALDFNLARDKWELRL